MKLKSRITSLVLSSVLLFAAVSPVYAASGVSARVKSESLNVRKRPSLYSDIISVLKKKTSLKILSPKKRGKSWYKVKLKSGKKGYVHKNYIKIKKNQLLIPASSKGYTGYSVKVKNKINTTKKTIKWTSSDPSVASVSAGGRIACKKTGTVKITAKAGTKTSSCKLKVTDASVRFKKDSYTAYLGSGMKLKANCEKPVTYKSSNKAVATVSPGGKLKTKKTGKVKITATSKSGKSDTCTVKIKKRALDISITDTTIYKGCRAIISSSDCDNCVFKSSDESVATVSESGIITGKGAGTAEITASAGTSTVTKKIKVKKGASVNISLDNDWVRKDMTLLIKSKTSGVKWSSTDDSVAEVNGGYVLGKKKGVAIIRAYTSKGANDCIVTVKAAEPVRFVYTSENSALPNQTINLYALTDKTRHDVKFKITEPDGKEYWVTDPKRSDDDSLYIWTCSKKFTKTGFYKIVGYAQTGKDKPWHTTPSGEGQFFVTKTESLTSCYKGERLITTKVLEHIAEYEGYASKVYDDPLVANTPTVGYGRVVYSGSRFYNGLTRKEAFAYLVNDINNSSYTTRINSILKDYNISFSQNHFDALVDFSYNLGVYFITNHSELLETLTSTYGKKSYKHTGYINKPSTPLRKSPKSSAKNLKTIKAGVVVTMLSTKVYNSSWYHVKLSSGKKGYIKKNCLTRRSSDSNVRNLKNVSVKTYAKRFLKYHHASKICYKGLLYRRMDELEIFFFNDYKNDGKKDKYGISFTCPYNSDFHIG